MLNRKAVIVTLLFIPAVVSAQGSGSRDKPRTTTPNYEGPGRNRAAERLSTGDLEGINPVKLLIEKRKNLALTDDQTRQLKDLDAGLKAKNDAFFHEMDSLRTEMKPSDAAPEVERIRMQGVRTSVAAVVTGVRSNYDASEAEALKVLNEEQQKTAKELLHKQREGAEEMLRQKLGGGRRGS